jgi:hypothetical protein
MLLTKYEKGYIAGFVDGEGCISCRTRAKKYLTPSIEVTNCNKEVLDWLASLFGGGIYLNKDFRPTRKDSYHWTVAGQKAIDCIKTIYPYLRIKKPQAMLVLSLKRFETKSRDKLGRIKGIMTEADFIENKLLLENIHKLNKRGKEVSLAS